MENVVTATTTALSAENLWGVIGKTVPILAIAVLVGLGFYLFRKITKGMAKGKARI